MVDVEQEYMQRDGHRLGVQRYRNPGRHPVLLLPAMGVPASYYRHFATMLHGAGADVAVVDLRGTGTSRPKAAREVNFGYHELADDVRMMCDRLRPEWDGQRTTLLGHSLGGQLGLLHLAREHSDDVKSAIIIASGMPYHGLYGKHSRLLYAGAAGMSAMSRMIGHWPGHGFGGRQPRRLIRDWAHTIHTGNFVEIDGHDQHDALSKIRQPILAITIDGDKLTPPAASRFLTDRLTATSVENYHCRGEETLDHFRWARTPPPDLVNRVVSFIGR